VVGVVAELEADEAVAAEDDPGQGRGEWLDRLDRSGEQGAVTGAGLLGLGGNGLSFLSLRVP
jgi:hypothetical protein